MYWKFKNEDSVYWSNEDNNPKKTVIFKSKKMFFNHRIKNGLKMIGVILKSLQIKILLKKILLIKILLIKIPKQDIKECIGNLMIMELFTGQIKKINQL